MQSVKGFWFGLALSLFFAGPATAEPVTYPWGPHAAVDDLARRFSAPNGASRVAAPPGSFAAFLRTLPLLPAGTKVLLFDGREKNRQDVHAAVVDIDVGKRDLQQCADAVMRMRSEYLFSLGRFADIRFHPDPGKPRVLAYLGGADRGRFERFLIQLFSAAGSASLEAELPARKGPVEPGDVLSQGGHPGHMVLVLDAATDATGKRYLLLGQSYMPAQQFHVLKNLGDDKLSPWFDEAALDGAGLKTPEWLPFYRKNVRQFPAN